MKPRVLIAAISAIGFSHPVLADQHLADFDLTGMSAEQCIEMLRALDREVEAEGVSDEPSLAGQVRQSVELYCRAARLEDDLLALGVDPATEPELPVRSLEAGTGEEDLVRQLFADREEALEGAEIYLDLAIAADPDAANDLLRRLLGKDPGQTN